MVKSTNERTGLTCRQISSVSVGITMALVCCRKFQLTNLTCLSWQAAVSLGAVFVVTCIFPASWGAAASWAGRKLLRRKIVTRMTSSKWGLETLLNNHHHQTGHWSWSASEINRNTHHSVEFINQRSKKNFSLKKSVRRGVLYGESQ